MDKKSGETSIEWAHVPCTQRGETLNPLAGCKPKSAGCSNCYAAAMALRLAAMRQVKYMNTAKMVNGHAVFTGHINYDKKPLAKMLRQKTPTTYFVNSMSDLFYEEVPFEFVDECFDAFAQAKRHIFQVLTKRPERMVEYLRRRKYEKHWSTDDLPEQIGNVWFGVTVENEQECKARMNPIYDLRNTLGLNGPVLFLSVEPQLDNIPSLYLAAGAADWMIQGGESGLNHDHITRFDPTWIASGRTAAGEKASRYCAYFFKQLGSITAKELGLKSLKGGDPSEYPASIHKLLGDDFHQYPQRGIDLWHQLNG